MAHGLSVVAVVVVWLVASPLLAIAAGRVLAFNEAGVSQPRACVRCGVVSLIPSRAGCPVCGGSSFGMRPVPK